MKTDKEWEARARELWGALRVGCDVWSAMLQLGREMSDERAEEIIAKLHAEVPHGVVAPHSWESAMWHAMAVARSTITKPKEPPTASEVVAEMKWTEAAIRADEREKVAKRIEACEGQWNNILGEPVMCVATAAALARAGEPKTREQVLEEALLEIERMTLPGEAKHTVARRALEWKP